MPVERATPIAILIGSGIIAAGVYFGLKAKPDSPASRTEPTAEASAAAPPASTPAQTEETIAKVNENVRAALQREKAQTFIPKCWTPALAKTPEPSHSKVTFDMAFDPQGKEIARAVSEVRGESRTDVVQCLSKLPIGIKIPAPGVGVSSIRADVSFP